MVEIDELLVAANPDEDDGLGGPVLRDERDARRDADAHAHEKDVVEVALQDMAPYKAVNKVMSSWSGAEVG